MIRKVIIMLLLLVLIGSMFVFLGPYLRGLKYEQVVQITATPTTYDCADGNCIGFIAQQISPIEFGDYVGKLLLPYDKDLGKDALQAKWVHLLQNVENPICIEGYLHKYSVSTLRFFQSGYGGYRVRLVNYKDVSCDTSVSR